MVWKLKVYFSDGTSTVDDEDYETEEAAESGYDSWLDSWRVGNDTLALANEDYSDSDIVDYDIWEED